MTDINTDAITCYFPYDEFPFDLIDEKNLDYYWDELKTVPKYKLEPNAKRVKYPKLVHYMIRLYNRKQWNYTDFKHL